MVFLHSTRRLNFSHDLLGCHTSTGTCKRKQIGLTTHNMWVSNNWTRTEVMTLNVPCNTHTGGWAFTRSGHFHRMYPVSVVRQHESEGSGLKLNLNKTQIVLRSMSNVLVSSQNSTYRKLRLHQRSVLLTLTNCQPFTPNASGETGAS